MNIIETQLPGVVIIEPDVFGDARGFFMETYSERKYADFGLNKKFVQDNLSFSGKGVLRGLHYQQPHSQGKLISVIAGEVYDVAVDIRVGSPTFGKWVGIMLSGENKRQVYIPEGFAHGFCVVSDTAYFSYKCTDFYSPQDEGGIIWNDPDIGIKWPLKEVILSAKDEKYPRLKDIAKEKLPSMEGAT